jgi:hypothetical protein
MHSFKSIPHCIVGLGGHPAWGYEQIENKIHNQKQNNDIKDLNYLLILQ